MQGGNFSLAEYVLDKTIEHQDNLRAGVPAALQSLLGHQSSKSTEVYTKVFALDLAARHRAQFHMPGADAVSMIRRSSD